MINKNNNKCLGHSFQVTGLAVAVALVTSPVWAGDTIEFEDGTTIDWSVTTSYGIGMRLGDPSSRLMGINVDDPNRNFDQHSLTTNRVGALGEMILRKDNYGAVVRASTFYDDVYHRSNDNNSPSTVNKTGSNDEFTSDTKYYSGGRTRLLDAYVFGGWRFENDTMLDVKAGRHIESWGESLYYPGVNGVQNPSDAVKAAQPGVEVKEVLLPVGQFSASYRINPKITLGGYVQYEWKGTELPPVGSYLSTSDVIGPGREFILGANGSRINYQGTDEPRCHPPVWAAVGHLIRGAPAAGWRCRRRWPAARPTSAAAPIVAGAGGSSEAGRPGPGRSTADWRGARQGSGPRCRGAVAAPERGRRAGSAER